MYLVGLLTNIQIDNTLYDMYVDICVVWNIYYIDLKYLVLATIWDYISRIDFYHHDILEVYESY